MLKVNLHKPEREKRKFVVFFDSEAKFTFTDQRKAEAFVNKVSVKCTEVLVFINTEYADLYKRYRDLFFEINNNDDRMAIERSFEYINSKINWMLFRTSGTNYNYMTIRNIEGCLNELMSLYTLITPVEISRRNTTIGHLNNVKSNVILNLLSDFLKFEEDLKINVQTKIVQLKVKTA